VCAAVVSLTSVCFNCAGRQRAKLILQTWRDGTASFTYCDSSREQREFLNIRVPTVPLNVPECT